MSEIELIETFEPFDERIRKVWDDETNEYWYAVVDVIEVLTETSSARRYWTDLKRREKQASGIELYAFCVQFPMKHKKNNRIYQTECSNQEGMLRIIQSIPSPKAEPFKQWLAMTGNRRLKEIKENPAELERERLRLLGFSEPEIERRLGHHVVRKRLVTQWEEGGITDAQAEDLTDAIHKGTFEGMTRKDHKELKGVVDLDEPVYDHMTSMEIAFAIVGEASTSDDIESEAPNGFDENLDSANRGGEIAGNLRESYEKQVGRKVISDKSPLIERRKEIENKNAND